MKALAKPGTQDDDSDMMEDEEGEEEEPLEDDQAKSAALFAFEINRILPKGVSK